MRKGLTLMELLVVISVLATLAALLYPVYLNVRNRMYAISCANQLRQIGLAIHMYVNDYGDGSPYFMSYPNQLYPRYIRHRDLLICPRVIALTPSKVMERFHQTKDFGYERTTYWFVSPIGLDDLKSSKGYPIGFSDVFVRRGDSTPIGYCSAHRFCPWQIGDFFAEEYYGEGGYKLCNDLFFTPGGPIIVLRWGGQVDFVFKGVPCCFINTDEFLVDF